jgi:hypothetical protein
VFEFYAVAFSPWIILFLVAGLREWFRNSPKPIRSANWITGFIGLAVLSSAFFYPIWSGIWIGYDFWHLMMWLPSWI